MKRAEAGYHMLLILSAIDGNLHGKEELIIKQFLEENKDFQNAALETEIISELKSEDYPLHFNKAMNEFYMDSTREQRNHFLNLATRLVIADKKISPRENLFLNELYSAWEEQENL
jgi:uncharacterized tellurite resistance protein B-like protein